MLLNNPNSPAGKKQQGSFFDASALNFLFATGKIKHIVNKELFSNVNNNNVKNLVQGSVPVQDLLRARAGNFWSINNNSLPAINNIDAYKIAFDVHFETTQSFNENTTNSFGEFTQNFTMLPNKALFQFDPGTPLRPRATYNPNYWRSFVFQDVVPHDGSVVIKPKVIGLTGPNLNVVNASPVLTITPNTLSAQTAVSSPNAFSITPQPFPTFVTPTPPAPPIASTTIGTQVTPNTIPTILNPIITASIGTNVLDPGSFIGIVPTIDNNKEFVDYAFNVNVPFSADELAQLNTSVGVLFADVKPTYNFFIDSYENVISNNLVKEPLLPDLYSFCSELQNQDTSIQNSIFRQHITLENNIQDIFIDVTNGRGQVIFERDEGLYYEKYAIALPSFLQTSSSNIDLLTKKFTNQVVSITNTDIVKKFNEKSVFFPMFVDINFSTDNATQFSQILQDSQLSNFLIKDLIDGNIPETNLTFQQSLVQETEEGKFLKYNVSSSVEVLRSWDINKWVDQITNNPVTEFDGLNNGTFLGSLNNEIEVALNPQFDFFKNLLVLIFAGKMRTLVDMNLRSLDDLLKGKVAYSENLFYKIEKVDAQTGGVIQNFYIPNSSNIDVLRFIDTQVKYNKQYTYNIFTYQMVLGNKYGYKLKALSDVSANIDFNNEPSIILTEVLLYTFTGRVMDEPPVSPQINVIPFRGINNKIRFNMDTAIGKYKLQPIIIEDGDDVVISQLREAQKVGDNDPIEYNTDDPIKAFEVFRINERPFSYQDFVGHRIAFITTDIIPDLSKPNAGSALLERASAASYIDDVLPNRKYYYIFRSIDIHGHISNPTDVYKIELVDNNGFVFPTIEIVNFGTNKDLTKSNKPVKKFIQLIPSFNQKIINENKSNIIVNGTRIDSALNLQDVSLGIANEQVWGKSYRLKITSRKTGKKININFTFNHKHLLPNT